MNALSKKSVSKLKNACLTECSTATVEQAFDAGAFAEIWLWCNQNK